MKKWVTANKAAEILSCSTSHVHSLKQRGKINAKPSGIKGRAGTIPFIFEVASLEAYRLEREQHGRTVWLDQQIEEWKHKVDPRNPLSYTETVSDEEAWAMVVLSDTGAEDDNGKQLAAPHVNWGPQEVRAAERIMSKRIERIGSELREMRLRLEKERA